ncbi:transposase [Sphaerisporangium perillae]|uniref:transposase n=1 Tax=Sphaerisporangium perillae TaxID=2935860 RepID=UPI00200DF5BF|nr:transposase [Sphaerisporangium perillae]
MGGKRRRFDPEFRAGAVRIVKETGKPVSQIARDLDINRYTLHNCRPQAEEWISARGLTGMLTEHPLDAPIYEWP